MIPDSQSIATQSFRPLFCSLGKNINDLTSSYLGIKVLLGKEKLDLSLFSHPYKSLQQRYEGSLEALTHFRPVIHIYAPLKLQKTSGFLIFSGGINLDHGLK